MDFQERISKICNEVNNDWSKVVRDRIDFVRDLPAADAVYHQQCNVYSELEGKYLKCFFRMTVQNKQRGEWVDDLRMW